MKGPYRLSIFIQLLFCIISLCNIPVPWKITEAVQTLLISIYKGLLCS